MPDEEATGEIKQFPSKHIDSIQEKAIDAEEYLGGWLYHYNVEQEIPLDILLSMMNKMVIFYSLSFEEEDG